MCVVYETGLLEFDTCSKPLGHHGRLWFIVMAKTFLHYFTCPVSKLVNTAILKLVLSSFVRHVSKQPSLVEPFVTLKCFGIFKVMRASLKILIGVNPKLTTKAKVRKKLPKLPPKLLPKLSRKTFGAKMT